ncbi:MAG: PQQ-binding-like beta-propeller repeat protein [Terriglobia bacterium]
MAKFLSTVAVSLFLITFLGAQAPQRPDGAGTFQNQCATCHQAGNSVAAPLPDQLRRMTRSSILRALESGKMKEQGSHLSADERAAVAEFLGTPDEDQPANPASHCAPTPFSTGGDPGWNGWGVDAFNTRFQPGDAARLGRDDVPKLQLKWAFGYPGASATFGQPTVAGGRVFVGSEDGTVYSLDARTGCVYWTFKAPLTVKTAVSMGEGGRAAYFGDTAGNVYAVNAENGSLLWNVRVDGHSAARITGSLLLVNERLYVPVSSGEEGAAVDPKYPCCTFRGSVVALDARTGSQIWKSYTIPEPPKPTGRRNVAGAKLYGPAGAAVWSPPTADLKARAIYVATGNSYTEPASKYADAVIAFDMDSGRMLWSHQFTENDLWNISCVVPDRANCPKTPGRDFDFGAPPILVSLANGKRVLLLGQKSGVVHAIDPDRRGEILWQARIGRGGPLGGIQWGGAADDQKLAFFPRSDWDESGPAVGGGLFAFRIATGERAWVALPSKPACAEQPGCSAAQMAPVTAIPGVVFSGSLDGHLRAYDTRDGTVIWNFDALREFQTVNGAKASGGSFNASGPAIVDGRLFVNSGYTNAISGNVLLAFTVDGK